MKVQVIEKKKGRIDRTTGEIIKRNLRVCAYARVSTEKEEQLNSYNSQLKYYEKNYAFIVYSLRYALLQP